MALTISVSLEVNPVCFEGRSLINYGIQRLNDREFDIFNKYFIEQMTMKEIAFSQKCSESRIFQLVTVIKGKVRRRLSGKGS